MSRNSCGISSTILRTRLDSASILPMLLARATAEWCNGSTAVSESACHGSNPCSAASFSFLPALAHDLVRLVVRDSFVKSLIAHHYRRCSAARQAFDKFHREFSIRTRLRSMAVAIQPQLLAQMLVQFVGTAQCAAQGPAHF